MLLNKKTIMTIFPLSLILVGCGGASQTPFVAPTNSQVGTAVGALAGGVAGSQIGGGSGQTVATIAGTMIGGFLGNQIGSSLDQHSQQQAMNAQMQALSQGQTSAPVVWEGTNGVRGNIVPQAAYNVNGQTCRKYTHTIYFQGRPELINGTACRDINGQWHPIQG